MTEPTTEAGRDALAGHREDCHSPGGPFEPCLFWTQILAIEAEARAPLQDQIAALTEAANVALRCAVIEVEAERAEWIDAVVGYLAVGGRNGVWDAMGFGRAELRLMDMVPNVHSEIGNRQMANEAALLVALPSDAPQETEGATE
jgi:hypothetical protein